MTCDIERLQREVAEWRKAYEHIVQELAHVNMLRPISVNFPLGPVWVINMEHEGMMGGPGYFLSEELAEQWIEENPSEWGDRLFTEKVSPHG